MATFNSLILLSNEESIWKKASAKFEETVDALALCSTLKRGLLVTHSLALPTAAGLFKIAHFFEEKSKLGCRVCFRFGAPRNLATDTDGPAEGIHEHTANFRLFRQARDC